MPRNSAFGWKGHIPPPQAGHAAPLPPYENILAPGDFSISAYYHTFMKNFVGKANASTDSWLYTWFQGDLLQTNENFSYMQLSELYKKLLAIFIAYDYGNSQGGDPMAPPPPLNKSCL
jgi:hypothetical protein